MTFYDAGNPVVGIKVVREAARRLSIEMVEERVTSVEELRERFMALGAKDADAYFFTPDAMATSQIQFIVDTANSKKLPTMMGQPGLVAQGALAAYAVDFKDIGHLSAKYVQRILTGTSPENLPIEAPSRYGLGINLKTARELGITIPAVGLVSSRQGHRIESERQVSADVRVHRERSKWPTGEVRKRQLSGNLARLRELP